MSAWIKAELPDDLHKWLRLRAVTRSSKAKLLRFLEQGPGDQGEDG